MIARFNMVETQVLCTDHAVSEAAFCRLVASVIGAHAEGHLELMVSDVVGVDWKQRQK